MTGSSVTEVLAWEALDSRGRPTVGCRVRLANGGTGRAIVPAGASTGGHEASERRDGGTRYAGMGVRSAVDAVNTVLGPAVRGADAGDRAAIDAVMEEVDGARDLGRLGANAVLGISLAVTLAAADGARTPLWRYLSGTAVPDLPLPMVNIVSGGAHARGAIDLQDILVVPVGATTFSAAIEMASRVRASAATLIDAGHGSSALIADEGGLAGRFTSNGQALALVTEAIERCGLRPGEDVCLAIDLAANQLLTADGYRLAIEDRTLAVPAWLAQVREWCDTYPIVSLEDVLGEDDWAAWHDASTILGRDRQLLGDDLFATDAARLTYAVEREIANAVLVKPNQAGTVTRAERVTATARDAGYATVISARSGDTEDSWLADFAVGWHCDQIKVGSTMRSERTAKWNRLLEIEAEFQGDAHYVGRAALGASSRRRGHPQPSDPSTST